MENESRLEGTMEKQELISVIIPVYNVEEYLRECIDSVLNQTYDVLEVILVDDGSSDASGDICDEYAEKYTRIQVIHQKNQGQAFARNTGFAVAKGKYIYFIDSDDWIVPETLEKLVKKAEQENAEIVFFDAYSYTEHPEKFHVEQRYLRKHQYITDTGYNILTKLQKHKEYHCSVPLLLLKREFLEENNICFYPGVFYEDMLYTYEVFCKSKCVAYIGEAFYQRRYRSNSTMTSRKNQKHYVSAKKVYEKVRNVSLELGLLEEDTARKYVVRCAFNALNIYKKMSYVERKENKESYARLKKDIRNAHAHGDQALYMRSYGTFLWFMYKVYEKSLGRILKGKK